MLAFVVGSHGEKRISDGVLNEMMRDGVEYFETDFEVALTILFNQLGCRRA